MVTKFKLGHTIASHLSQLVCHKHRTNKNSESLKATLNFNLFSMSMLITDKLITTYYSSIIKFYYYLLYNTKKAIRKNIDL